MRKKENVMAATGSAFLVRLAGIAKSRWSHCKAWNIPVDSAEYEEIMRPCKEKADKIVRLYGKGYMTEDEAAVELARLIIESEA